MAAGAAAMLVPAGATAADRAGVRDAAPAPRPSPALRLKILAARPDPRLRIDDPQSPLRTGNDGSMVDLFPFEGSSFHLSAGAASSGRMRRARGVAPENQQYLPSFRPAGVGGGRRREAAAMLVGYGRTVDRGLTLGVDTGVVMGRVMAPPPGAGRLMRLQSSNGGPAGVNEVARATMLFRF